MFRKSSSTLTTSAKITSPLTEHYSSPLPFRFDLQTGTGSIWLYFNNHQQKKKSLMCHIRTHIEFEVNLFYK